MADPSDMVRVGNSKPEIAVGSPRSMVMNESSPSPAEDHSIVRSPDLDYRPMTPVQVASMVTANESVIEASPSHGCQHLSRNSKVPASVV